MQGDNGNMVPADAGNGGPPLATPPAPQSRCADAQAEAEERARYLRARLAQLHAAYLEERTGVLPPLAIPRPTSLNVEDVKPMHLSESSPRNDSDNNACETSDWSHVSAPTGTNSITGDSEFSVVGRSTIEDMGDLTLADTDSAVSISALSASEASALSASSRLARTNADAARYYDAYRSARLDAVEAQLARRNLSRTLAQRDAENNTLKAILQLHTMSQHLRDSEGVLDAARKVHRLQDEMASQHRVLRTVMQDSTASKNDRAPASNSRRKSGPARPAQQTTPADTQSHMDRSAIEDVAWQTYLKAKNHPSMKGRTPADVVDAILASSAITTLDPDQATLLNQDEVVLELLRQASVETVGDTVEAHFHQAQTQIWESALHIACAIPGLIGATDPIRVREMVQGQCPELAPPPCQCSWKRTTALLGSYGLKLQVASIEAVARSIVTAFPLIANAAPNIARAWIQSQPDRILANVPFYIDPDDVKALLLSERIIGAKSQSGTSKSSTASLSDSQSGSDLDIKGDEQEAMRAVPISPKRDFDKAMEIDDTPNKRPRGSTASTSALSGGDRSADVEALANASRNDIEACVDGYAKLHEEASIMLEALFARHKVLAQGLCDEAALQEKGFYRLNRAQLEAVHQYPQMVVLDGETYVMSTPLESTTLDTKVSGGTSVSGLAVDHKGKGKAPAPAEDVSGLVTNDLDTFRKAWKDELELEEPLTEQRNISSSDLFDSSSDTDTEVPDEGFASDCFEEV